MSSLYLLPAPSPIDYLPPPFLEAVSYVCQRAEAPPEVVVADVLALVSTVTQRLYKVKGLKGSLMPTTLNTLSLAPTGCGKYESYRRFFQPPTNLDAGEFIELAQGIDKLLSQDLSPSALMDALAGCGKSVSIQLEDGYSFLLSALMKPDNISKLTPLWSGPPSLKIGRHRNNKIATEPCLAIGLRIQPILFYPFLQRDKNLSYDLGLWPRFLTFCYDPDRFPVVSWNPATIAMPSHGPLMERLTALMSLSEAPEGTEPLPRKVLVMDTQAHARLDYINHWIKSELDGQFRDIQGAARRAAENTLRLASNFHVVCHGEGPIPVDMIDRAWHIVFWSLTQFRQIFVHAIQPPPKPLKLKPVKPLKQPRHQQRLNSDMQFVLDCINTCSRHTPYERVPAAHVMTLSGFPKTRFFQALMWLGELGFVEVAGDEANGTIRLLPPQQIALNGHALPC
jgi:hypothetical protein